MNVMAGVSGGGLKRGSRIAAFTVAGLIGGAIGSALAEIPGDPVSESDLNPRAGLTFMMIVAAIGVAVLVADTVLRGSAPSGAVVGRAAVALLALGYASGYIAQTVFSKMLEDPSADMTTLRIARTVGWGIAGLLGGLGIGLGFGSVKRVQNALIGGVAGGTIGGFLFDYVAEYGPEGGDGLAARVVATCIIGLLIGLLISLAEAARIDMWLEIVSGEARGRQYLVFDTVTQVGRSRSAGVSLVGDRFIGEVHFTINRTGGGASFSVMPPNAMLHNGQPVSSGVLSNGDVLRVGNTDVAVRYKAATATTVPYPVAPGAPATWDRSIAQPAPAPGRPNASPVSNAPSPGYVPPPPPPPGQHGASAPLPPRQPSSPAAPPASRPRLPTKPN